MTDEDRRVTATVDMEGLVPTGRSSRKHVYVVVLGGLKAGALYRLGDSETIIGRAPACDIVLTDDGVSRTHAKIVRRSPSTIEVEDLGSTNGVYVAGQRVTSKILRDGERFAVAGTLFKVYFGDELEEDLQRGLYESAVRDGLTGLHNRRHLEEQLVAEFSFAKRHRVPLSFVIFDLDFFKKINDQHGHRAGDEVLRDVAEALQATTRIEDTVARYGGEEFAILARQTDAPKAVRLAERVRTVVAGLTVHAGDKELHVTISAGVACHVPHDFPGPTALVEAADKALYLAKERGRNQVVVWEG
jgi:diguanylate cyclase (GGDEF)-like protein